MARERTRFNQQSTSKPTCISLVITAKNKLRIAKAPS